MSHVVTVGGIDVTDLEVLQLSGEALGMELVEKSTYKFYGRWIGDYPLPEGFSQKDLGKCEYVLRVKDAGPETYEVGVVKRRDGKPGYSLLFDFWQNGFGLLEKIGENADKLKGEYKLQAAMKAARRQGFRTSRTVDPKTGKPMATLRRTR